MANEAYACRITTENLPAIGSEFGPGWNRQIAIDWLAEHKDGWFLRDESSVLDRKFFVTEVFFTMYVFVGGSPTSIYRRVEAL